MFFTKKKSQDILEVKEFLKFASEQDGSILEDSEVRTCMQIWFEACIVPWLPMLQSKNEISYDLYIPTSQELTEQLMKGEYELRPIEQEALAGYEYFFLMNCLSNTSPEFLTYMILETISRKGYRVRWECQKKTIRFFISLF